MKRPLALWILIVFLFQITAPTWVWAQSNARFEVTINTRALNVRSGPGTDSDILASVTQGDEVIGLRRDSGWVQIELPTGAIGWVKETYVIIGNVIQESEAEPEPEPERTPPPRQIPPPSTSPERSGGGGGIGIGGILKWTSLVGALALGGLAYNEKSQGDDTYTEYEALAISDPDAAELKWEETADHDDKAQLYGIVAGGLFGVFLLQQFVFKGGDDSADLRQPAELPAGLAYNPRTGELRANLVQVRF